VMDVPLPSGMLVHMGGDFQKEFTHEVPIEKKIREGRYSFTFRQHLQGHQR
jgi:alkylated DNA repair dioxygenase AlkB